MPNTLTFRGKPLVNPPTSIQYIPVDVYNGTSSAEKAVTDIQAVQGTPYARIAGAEGAYLTRLVNLPVKDASVGNMCDLYPDTFKSMTSVPDQLDLGERTSLGGFFSATPKDVHYVEDGFDDYIQDGDGGCRTLLTAPMMNTSGITDMSFMFGMAYRALLWKTDDYGSELEKSFDYINACVNMTSIPQYDTSNVTNFNYMFAYCENLRDVPELNMSKAENVSYMFQGCTSLPKVFPWTIFKSGNHFYTPAFTSESFLIGMFEGSSVEEVSFTAGSSIMDIYGNSIEITPELLDSTGTLKKINFVHS